MRVLHVIEATIGGTRRHVVDVTRGLARRGVEVQLVASTLREPAFREDLAALEAEGVSVWELPMTRAIRPGGDLAHMRWLERHLRRERPDIIHTHSSKAGVVGRLASMSAEIGRRVHTPHTFAFLFESMFGPLKRGLFRALETHLASATELSIAVSEGEAETMRSSGVVPRERIRVVPNGIDPALWSAAEPADLSALDLPTHATVCVVAGLLNVAKGQDLAIRALAAPGAEGVHLLLAGHGELAGELDTLARELGLAERVTQLGWRDDLPRLFAAADFVCLPSRWEGMPYAALEAMAAGRPVVATRVDGARQLVDESTGALVAVESPAELGAAFAQQVRLGAAGRESRGAAGQQRVAAGYSCDTMVTQLLEAYAELA